MKRTILHCDCNSFYASVECAERPELLQVPMAVCGNPENRHGIILAKNELAKAYDIRTAETVGEALRKCPTLTLVPPHRKKYIEYSNAVNAVYARYTDLVEPFSIDESWLDVTGSRRLFGSGAQIAHTIKEEIKNELKITISVGVSYNKIFAKLGSDYKKPDAVTVIEEEDVPHIVWPLPVSALMFVGGNSKEKLAKIGIRTIGQLAHSSPAALKSVLGNAAGETLYRYATGAEDSPVRHIDDSPPPKSIGNGLTFKRNLVTKEDYSLGLTVLADSVAARLRMHRMKCSTIQLAIKDVNLKVIVRQKPVPPTFLEDEIMAAAMELLLSNWKTGVPIRMLTITASGLFPENAAEQLSLFPSSDPVRREKKEQLERSIDLLREKYGAGTIRRGNTLHPEEIAPGYLQPDDG